MGVEREMGVETEKVHVDSVIFILSIPLSHIHTIHKKLDKHKIRLSETPLNYAGRV